MAPPNQTATLPLRGQLPRSRDGQLRRTIYRHQLGTDGYDVTITETYDCSFKSWSESVSCTMSVSMGGIIGGGTTASSSTSKATPSVATSSYWKLDVTGAVDSFTAPAATETPGAAAAGPAGALITAAPIG
ncbi:hypothetical protein N7445_008895 [Penicillium cf. griseofulvum]|nr:hypothetical protein N7445_008895 [Penicillium cf. griseofulvum]